MDADTIHDLFSVFGPVERRRLFGGAGLYADGLMFAIVMGDIIYLKIDDGMRAIFEAEGCAPFGYETKTGRHVLTSYWQMPERLYDDADELAVWVRRALHAAQAKKAAKRLSGKTKTAGTKADARRSVKKKTRL